MFYFPIELCCFLFQLLYFCLLRYISKYRLPAGWSEMIKLICSERYSILTLNTLILFPRTSRISSQLQGHSFSCILAANHDHFSNVVLDWTLTGLLVLRLKFNSYFWSGNKDRRETHTYLLCSLFLCMTLTTNGST